MSELTALPSATAALREFDTVIQKIRAALPGGGDKKASEFGKTAIEGAVIGAGVGSIFPGVGTLGGAALGGVVGGVYGLAQDYMKSADAAKVAAPDVDRFGRATVITGNSADQAAKAVTGLAGAIRSLGAAPGGVFPGGTSAAPMHWTPPPGGGKPAVIYTAVHLDGRVLARSTTNILVRDLQAIEGSVDHDGVGGAPHPASFRI